MKLRKTLLLLFLVPILVVGCSKSKKLNKRLDGGWTLTSYLGHSDIITPYPKSTVLTFKKVNNNGGTYVITNPDTTFSGIYTLQADYRITFNELIPDTIQGINFDVIKYTKTDLSLKDKTGQVFFYTKN